MKIKNKWKTIGRLIDKNRLHENIMLAMLVMLVFALNHCSNTDLTDCSLDSDTGNLKCENVKKNGGFLNALGLALINGGVQTAPESAPISAAPPLKDGSSVSKDIIAASGGTISLENEVTLVIPPNSLSQDTTITITKQTNQPSDGKTSFEGVDQAYKFEPAGTEFDIRNPAKLTIKYDQNQVNSKSLDSSLMEIFYYNEEMGQYINTPAAISASQTEVTSNIEHFTLYALKAGVIGVNNPVVVLQDSVPQKIRADAPIYVRATVMDRNDLQAITAVTVTAKKLQSGVTMTARMMREVRPNSLPDTYAYLIPSTFLTSSDLGGGDDLEISVTATDNTNLSTTATVRHNITRRLQPGSFSVTVANTSLSAGYQTLAWGQARDDSNNLFDVVPESFNVITVSGTGFGTLGLPMANGVVFTGTKTGKVSIQANFNGNIASSTPVTISLGELAKIKVYEVINPLTLKLLTSVDINNPTAPDLNSFGIVKISEGISFQFDVLGEDAFGNTMAIFPDWKSQSNLGPTGLPDGIDQSGKLYTLDGSGFGNIDIGFGGITYVSQSVEILTRIFREVFAPLDNKWQSEKWPPTFKSGITYDACYWRIDVFPARWECGNPSGKPSETFWRFTGSSDHLIDTDQTNIYFAQNLSFEEGKTDYTVGSYYCYEWFLGYCVKQKRDWIPSSFITTSRSERQIMNKFDGSALHDLGNYHTQDTTNNTGLQNHSIKAVDSTVYAAYVFFNGTVNILRVKSNSTDIDYWLNLGGVINTDSANNVYGAKIGHDGTYPWVVWTEDMSGIHRVIAARYINGAWSRVGLPLNAGANSAENGNIDFDSNGNPYIAYHEFNGISYELIVKTWNGFQWTAVGNALNFDTAMDTSRADIEIVNGKPYVTWLENDINGKKQVYVKRYNGASGWGEIGTPGSHNLNAGISARGPEIKKNKNDTVYLSWVENNAMHLKHFNQFQFNWNFDRSVTNAYTGIAGSAFTIKHFTPYFNILGVNSILERIIKFD